MDAPAITMSSVIPESGLGWKNASQPFTYNVEAECNKNSVINGYTNIEDCIIQNTFARKEVFTDVIKGYSVKESLINITNPSLWTEDFAVSYIGRTYTINIPRRIGPDYYADQIFVMFKREHNKNIFIHDRNYFLPKLESVGIPIDQYIKLSPQNLPNSHYWGIVVTEVEELDVLKDPCNLDHDYTFQVCLKVIQIQIQSQSTPMMVIFPRVTN